MSNSFEILMNQLGMPAEMRQAPALAQADIERVVVHKISVRYGSFISYFLIFYR